MDSQTRYSDTPRHGFSLLRLLGFGRNAEDAAPEALRHASAAQQTQGQHLADIGRFLEQHGLPVTTATLGVVWTVLTRTGAKVRVSIHARPL